MLETTDHNSRPVRDRDDTEVTDSLGNLGAYYLARIYHREAEPFDVVMDLPMPEAKGKLVRVTSYKDVIKTTRGAAYLETREKVENWLRAEAQKAGVVINKQMPVYFCLTDNPVALAHKVEAFAKDLSVVFIPVAHINITSASFTYDDSFHNHAAVVKGETYGVPLEKAVHGRVLNAWQMAQLLEAHPLLGTYGDERYIEVQMWENKETLLNGAFSVSKQEMDKGHVKPMTSAEFLSPFLKEPIKTKQSIKGMKP